MTTRSKANGTTLERRVVADAKKAGLVARKQPLSGVLADFPNDVQIGDVLVECKMRAAFLDAKGEKTISLKLDWLHNVIRNAKRVGFRTGILVSRAKGSPQLYVTLEWQDFLELVANSRDLSTSAEN